MRAIKAICKPVLMLFYIFLICVDGYACTSLNKPIPNSVKHSRYNTECFVNAINHGKKIRINDTYYLSRSEVLVHNDIIITGKGKLILTDSEIFTVDTPISVKVKNITISTTQPKRYNSQIRFIVSKSRLYHKEVRFENCLIDGVRLYTQIADDVDQKIIKDGVKKFIFKGNTVSSSCFCVVRLGNCLCDEAVVKNNVFTRMQSILFDFGLDNDYQNLGFCRFKRVYFNNNIVDNDGLLIDANYDFLYCTPILAECDYAECKGNKFKSIICINKNPIALYAFYLSGNTVIISENEMIDCINLGNSMYNAIFKCKGNMTKDGVRIIAHNKCIITEECLDRYSINKSDVFTRLISLQSECYESVIIINNDIKLACNFVFGSGSLAEYKYYKFENNSIKYHDIGPTARQLLRLSPAKGDDNTIIVRHNVMSPEQPPSNNHGLFAYDCTGYSITVSDNVLYGYLPYGDNETEVYSLRYGTSENNMITLGTNASLVRVSINNLIINDKIISNSNYSIKLYNDSELVSTHFTFEGQPPLSMVSNTDVVYGTKPMFMGKQSITVWKGKAVIE